MSTSFELNGEPVLVDDDPTTPLLWVLRDSLGFVGTKYGCGVAQCGACTVHINGAPTRSCVMPIAAVQGQKVATIEGLKQIPCGAALQKSWIEKDVSQCGYCQAGQMMTACALLEKNSSPSHEEIQAAMSGNLCRCGTYDRIVDAIGSAAEGLRDED